MMQFKSPLGRPPKYTPKQLAEEFSNYVQWCKDNPLSENQRTDYQKGYADTTAYKPRRISIEGFRIWLGCSDTWWERLDERKGGEQYVAVKKAIKEYCETYQKDMASAGLLNANIISRLLGLSEKQEVKQTGQQAVYIVKSEEEKEKVEDIGELGV